VALIKKRLPVFYLVSACEKNIDVMRITKTMISIFPVITYFGFMSAMDWLAEMIEGQSGVRKLFSERRKIVPTSTFF